MSDPDRKTIVERGYDVIAERYAEWARTEITGSPAVSYLQRLLELLADGSDVLELGSGNGEPAARMLAERHRYTGVDISRAQVELARQAVPGASFVQADYTQLELPERSFDAVVALFTLTHVPREEHAGLFRRIAGWLRPGGIFLASLGRRDNPGAVDEDWLGAPMFFSGWDTETNLRLLSEAGLEVVEEQVVAHDEGVHGEVRFHWVIARR